MAALLPVLASAIMGSGANRKFNPRDPNSMPYEERKTGFGRFFSRLGGVDAGALNNEYNQKRGLMDVEQANRAQLIDKDMEGRKGLQTAGQEHEWKVLQSRLANEAALQQQQQGFQTRLQDARLQEGRADRSAEQFNRYGTYDPILQQDIASRMREDSMTAPRPLGGKAIYNPADKSIYGYNEPGFDLQSGKTTGGSWQRQNLGGSDASEPAPSGDGAPSTSISKDDLVKAGLLVPAGQGGGGQPTAGSPIAPQKPGGFFSRLLGLMQNVGAGVPTPLNRDFMQGLDKDTLNLRSRIQGLVPNR